MARTIRNHNERVRRSARRTVDGESYGGRFYPFEDNHPNCQRRTKAILRGDDGRIIYDKCRSARIDGEGSWKLNTWDESSSKRNDAHRKRRKADKILAKRQLEDAD